jgi:uncharacterized protein YukE
VADIASSTLHVPVDLADASHELNTYSGDFVQKLGDLKTKLAPIAETWTGPAASYYHPLQAEWSMAAEGLFGQDGVLGQIAHAMHITWNNYSECEEANIKGWQHH